MNSSRFRTTRRIGVGVAAVAIATLGLALPAWAHVDAELGDVSQSGLAEVTFGFHHGCDGAATTGLRIQVPKGVTNITLGPVEGFTTNVSATEFGWSGGSVPDGQEASFIATAQLTGQQGDVIAFPTIQQCGETEIAWVEAPESGSEDETQHPSPSVTLPATYEAPTTSTAAGPATSTTASTFPTGLVTPTTVDASAMPETTASNTTGLIVFLVTVSILVGGAVYLYLSNRRPRPPAGLTQDEPTEDGPGPDSGTDGPMDSSRGNRSPH